MNNLMTMKQLEDKIDSATREEWKRLSTNHPALTAVMSEPLLIAGARESLLNDAAAMRALRDAMVAGATAEQFAILMDAFVVRYVRGLFSG